MRSGHELLPEKSRGFQALKDTENYAKENNMKINYKKTKLMIFNPSRTKDLCPKFSFNDNELEIVEQTKLLGLIVRSGLSWTTNTEYMVERENKKLWKQQNISHQKEKTTIL